MLYFFSDLPEATSYPWDQTSPPHKLVEGPGFGDRLERVDRLDLQRRAFGLVERASAGGLAGDRERVLGKILFEFEDGLDYVRSRLP